MNNSPLSSIEEIRAEINRNVFARHRAAEDAKRDPVDAYNDSETLCRVLDYVTQVMRDPSLRFLVGDRIREDLRASDLSRKAQEAHLLHAFNLARLNEHSKSFNDQN